jgi:hypothetical protein
MDAKSRQNWQKIVFYQKVSSMVAGVTAKAQRGRLAYVFR